GRFRVAGPGRQNRGAVDRVCSPVALGAAASARLAALAVRRRLAPTRRDDSLALATAIGLPRSARGFPGKKPGSALLRAWGPRLEPRLRREHIRQCGRSAFAAKRRGARCGSLDRAYGLRDLGAPFGTGEKEGDRAAPREQSHRAATRSGDVLGG